MSKFTDASPVSDRLEQPRPLQGAGRVRDGQGAANNADLGTMLLTIANEGDPYFAFASLPSAILNANDIGANFTGAPTVNADAQINRNNVAGLLASPPAVGATNDGTNVVWAVD